MQELSQIDLSLLSQTDKTKIERNVLELKRRRREERSRYFVPSSCKETGHDGKPANDQLGFFLDPAPERWAFGGNRSGKTEIGIYDCNEFATGRHPVRSKIQQPPVKIRACGQPNDKSGNTGVIIDKFKTMVRRCDLWHENWDRAYSSGEKRLFYNDGRKPGNKGSFVEFKSWEQDVDKFGGFDGDAIYGDEHCSIRHYRENCARLFDRGGFYVHSMTPEAGTITWEKRHVLSGNPDIKHYFFSTYGNLHVNKESIDQFVRKITDERVKEVKIYGRFVSLAGLVYDNFNENKSYFDFGEDFPPKEWPRVCVLDPHIKKEHAILWGALSPENEFWIYRTLKVNATPEELKQIIRGKSAGENVTMWIADEAMGGDKVDNFGNRSILSILQTGNNRIPFVGTAQKSEGQFQAGVMKVREGFNVDIRTGRPSILINRPECQELIDEINEYQFMPETAADELTFREKVRHVFDDLSTCLRYGWVYAITQSAGGSKIESGLDGAWS